MVNETIDEETDLKTIVYIFFFGKEKNDKSICMSINHCKIFDIEFQQKIINIKPHLTNFCNIFFATWTNSDKIIY